MPVDERGRAAASITQPLDAEVRAEGAWWPGAVLGWCHDAAGGCEAEVRVAVRGVERVRWVALDAVRLPEPGRAPEGARKVPAEPAVETVVMDRAELRQLMAAGLPARRRRHASDLTAELPVVRCAEAEEAPGRHRAPAGVGRHRATDVARPAAAPDLLTRPIRLEDVAGWSWNGSVAAAAR